LFNDKYGIDHYSVCITTVSLTSSDADNTICAGETVTFTANSATATSYEFFVDGILVQKSGSNQYTINTLPMEK
jgi:hypothetical protein